MMCPLTDSFLKSQMRNDDLRKFVKGRVIGTSATLVLGFGRDGAGLFF